MSSIREEFLEACGVWTGNIDIDKVRQLRKCEFLNPTKIGIYTLELGFEFGCQKGNLELVQEIHKWNHEIVDSASFDRLFVDACYEGNTDLVGQLIEWKLMIVFSASYNRALEFACISGNYEIVRLLREKKNSLFPDVPLDEEIGVSS